MADLDPQVYAIPGAAGFIAEFREKYPNNPATDMQIANIFKDTPDGKAAATNSVLNRVDPSLYPTVIPTPVVKTTPIVSLLSIATSTYGALVAASGSAPSAPSAPSDTRSEEQIASDERLDAQCMLIDFLPQLASYNYAWRYNTDNKIASIANGGGGLRNPYMIGMWGDGEQFSSNIHGSVKKSKFLDFTTAQLSSLVPIMKFYKIQQLQDGKNKDYLIPFSTHAAWNGPNSTFGTVKKNNDNDNLDTVLEYGQQAVADPNYALNVGVKNFNWEFQGSNPVSSKVDIQAQLTLFAKSLTDLILPFNIYPTDGSEEKLSFQYVDMILRSGTKFNPGKLYNPKYYRIKTKIGWKTENTELFTKEERECLDANTSTLILTLIDHQFDFGQDGTVTLKMNYRAYFESLFASEDADMLRSKEQAEEVTTIRTTLQDIKKRIDEAATAETDAPVDNRLSEEYKAEGKKYDDLIDQLNKDSFKRIIDEITDTGGMKYVQVDVARYSVSKSTPNTIPVGLITDPEPSDTAITASKEAIGQATEANGNPNLKSLVPKTIDGKKNLAFFYLGDLLYNAINNVRSKIDGEDFPYFIFGSALYKNPSDPTKLEYINILDIPISIEWFSEWFTSTIIAQDKETYQLLYFIRELCSKLITGLLSSYCDKTGSLKYRNRLNTANFALTSDITWEPNDIAVNPTLSKTINDNYPIMSEETPIDSLKEYVAVYCQDKMSPPSIDFCADREKGIYHFYFGQDRGLVKNIKFTRSQVVGLRETNYARESDGIGLEQLMLPYDVDITMVGNNLMYNGMMIMIDPSGFGRRIGQPDDANSISFKLKLGGYHLVYRVESSLSIDGFETKIKARWIGSGRANALDKNGDSGTVYGAATPLFRGTNPPPIPATITVVPGATTVGTASIPGISAVPEREIPVHGGRG